MNGIAASVFGPCSALLATSGPWAGKLAFVLVFVLLLAWLLLMPARLVADDDGHPRWWRNTRVRAVLVTVMQIVIYLRWG
ncbi:MAG: hypothetical protein HQ582_26805 [Planctomycetes bacterium]|nr:hypothetical protein [Planctomycetota bacterium]